MGVLGHTAAGGTDGDALAGEVVPNLGIITSYNDMLSAHQPLETFPALLKDEALATTGRR